MHNAILIISCENDVHSNIVETRLLEMGGHIIRLNTESVGSGTHLTFDENGQGTISIFDKEYFLNKISSIWYRRPTIPQLNINDSGQREFAKREIEELIKQLYYLMPQASWVSNPHALEASRRKIPQLVLAQKLGFRVPRTCASNSPEEVKKFVSSCKSGAIYKTLKYPVLTIAGSKSEWGVPTTKLTEVNLADIRLIEKSGGIFQEYIEKAWEIRVTVVGDTVFAAKIDSQSHHDSKVDWRDGVNFGHVAVSSIELPDEIEKTCLCYTKTMGLNFGAIDLIFTPEGDYVFLEINSNGQWVWQEELTGQPMIEAMCRYLLKP